MLEVYDMIELGTPLIVKIAWYVFIISFVGMSLTAITLRDNLSKKRDEITGFFLKTFATLGVISMMFLMASAFILDKSASEGKKLSKDQYALNVINQQIIKPANDKHQMRIDRKDFDALKIVTETNESYIVEGGSKDNSLHKTLELKKSDYKFERK